jgi:hypothetical protein
MDGSRDHRFRARIVSPSDPQSTPTRARRVVALGTLLTLVATLFAVFGASTPASADVCVPLTDVCVSLDGVKAKDSGDPCKEPPTATGPSSGTGFFVSEPGSAPNKYNADDPTVQIPTPSETRSRYDVYGYAGLSYNTYDVGSSPLGSPVCVPDVSADAWNGFSNLLLNTATLLVSADNALREWAYDPATFWEWTDELVQNISDSLRDKIFSVWGAAVLGLVGLWLLWGARRGNWSDAAITAGWAIFVMVLVSAVAAWPVRAASVADDALTGTVSSIHGALAGTDPSDDRTPAQAASGAMTDTLLYQQWLRGTLGSSDSDTAKKYGPLLFDAQAISWAEEEFIARHPDQRAKILDNKKRQWKAVADRIEKEDPEAYSYLTGKRTAERVGSSMLALIATILVTPFDVVACLLIVIAFLIIRFAVAFLPAIGTVAIFRPTSAPLRSLFGIVVAALINCAIFAGGSMAFLLALQVITDTASLAAWQQLVLIFLTGLVLWLLLRPFRRLTHLTNGNPLRHAHGLRSRQRRILGGGRDSTAPSADEAAVIAARGNVAGRPEHWSRPIVVVVGVNVAVGADGNTRVGVQTAADLGEDGVVQEEEIIDGQVIAAGGAGRSRRPMLDPSRDPRRVAEALPVAARELRDASGTLQEAARSQAQSLRYTPPAVNAPAPPRVPQEAINLHESNIINVEGTEVVQVFRPGVGVTNRPVQDGSAAAIRELERRVRDSNQALKTIAQNTASTLLATRDVERRR